MSKHKMPRTSLLQRVLGPVVQWRAFQLELDRRVVAVLDGAGMTVGGITLNDAVRQSEESLIALAAEVNGMGDVPTLLKGRPDRLQLVARSIQRVHRLALSYAYDSAS